MAELRLADGGHLHYELAGSGSPLLLVPGLGGLAEFWNPVLPALAERFTVILHDHRGCGRSSQERIDFSIGQMAGDVLALLDHLGLEKAHLVGHSTGGAVGQTIALDHPGRLDRLVLSGTWAAPDAYFESLFATRSAILRAGGPALYLQSSALMLYPPWWIRDHPALVTITEEAARARVPDPEILLARIAAILRHDRLADLHRVTAGHWCPRRHGGPGPPLGGARPARRRCRDPDPAGRRPLLPDHPGGPVRPRRRRIPRGLGAGGQDGPLRRSPACAVGMVDDVQIGRVEVL